MRQREITNEQVFTALMDVVREEVTFMRKAFEEMRAERRELLRQWQAEQDEEMRRWRSKLEAALRDELRARVEALVEERAAAMNE